MKVVKSNICNKMDDQWLNDRLVTYIETNVLLTINNDVILSHFQQMDRRRFLLYYSINVISYFKYSLHFSF